MRGAFLPERAPIGTRSAKNASSTWDDIGFGDSRIQRGENRSMGAREPYQMAISRLLRRLDPAGELRDIVIVRNE